MQERPSIIFIIDGETADYMYVKFKGLAYQKELKLNSGLYKYTLRNFQLFHFVWLFDYPFPASVPPDHKNLLKIQDKDTQYIGFHVTFIVFRFIFVIGRENFFVHWNSINFILIDMNKYLC